MVMTGCYKWEAQTTSSPDPYRCRFSSRPADRVGSDLGASEDFSPCWRQSALTIMADSSQPPTDLRPVHARAVRAFGHRAAHLC